MNIYQQDHTQVPELFTLIREHRNAEVRAHLERHPEELNLKGWMGNTPILEAACAGNEEIVELLLKSGANVNSPRTGVYRLPVCWAKTARIAELMFEHGAEMTGEELSYATRSDNVEVIETFLAHGAALSRIEPEYLLCHSVKALEVYRASGIDIAQPGKYGRNLLHQAALKDDPVLFEYAFSVGVPYQKDHSFRTPYYTAKKDSKLSACLREKYPQFSQQRIIAAEWNRANRNSIVHLQKVPGSDGILIGLTRNSDLIQFAIAGSELACEAVVNVDVPPATNFTFNEDGLIVLPAGEDQLLLIDPFTLQLIKRVYLACGEVSQITRLPLHHRYYASSSSLWQISILNEQFQLEHIHALKDGLFFPIINPQETLVSLYSYDQDTYHCLFTIDAAGKPAKHEYTFYGDTEASGRGMCIDGHAVFTASNRVLNAYRWTNDGPEPVWEVNASTWGVSADIQIVTILNDEQLLAAAGNQFIVVSRSSGKMERRIPVVLKGKIQGLLVDAESERIVAWSDLEETMME